jgi:calcineurin-like phosphoesterase
VIKQIFAYCPILIGISLISLGFIGWKKQKIFLNVDKNKIYIKEENIKEFTESIGKTYIVFGISMLIIRVINLTNNDIYNFTALIISMLLMIIGAIKSIRTHKKYKTGLWSK